MDNFTAFHRGKQFSYRGQPAIVEAAYWQGKPAEAKSRVVEATTASGERVKLVSHPSLESTISELVN